MTTNAERMAAYYAAHKDEIRERRRAKYAADPERYRKRARERYSARRGWETVRLATEAKEALEALAAEDGITVEEELALLVHREVSARNHVRSKRA